MGLSNLVFLAVAGLPVIMVIVARRGRGTPASKYGLLIDAFFLLAALFDGLTASGANSGSAEATIFAYRAAGFALVAAQFFLLAFALHFPQRLYRWVAAVPFLLAALTAAAAWVMLGTKAYISGAYFINVGFLFRNAGYVPNPGNWYIGVNIAGAGAGALAVIIHLLRSIRTKDSINRQRSALAVGGLAPGVAVIFLAHGLAPATPGGNMVFALPALMAMVIAGVQAYALRVSRLFDWREFFRSLLAYTLVAIIIGLPTGCAVALLALLGSDSPLLMVIIAPLIYFVAWRLARSFSKRYFERVGSRREYREMLESTLAHIDLSAGRDAVLRTLHEILTRNLGFSDFSILIEDDRNVLKTSYSSSGGHASLDRADALRAHIESTDSNVLMLSEAQADPRWLPVKTGLLGLFSALKAEVLIFARESRRVIGVFAFGARRIGGEYTDYDYETFQALCGKLFVFAFYLKNVARESIVYTVDRELALSDQVIRFALEHVAPVEHPRADAAWAMRSTRSLGGDFVDFVRIGKERWFFVLGDVSGKGLSASMNMLILKSMIRTFLRIEKDFAGLVQRVNLFVKEHLPKGSFFAGVFGYFDFGTNSLYFVNCGVPAILLYSPSFDAFIEVQGEGKVLGFVRDLAPYLRPRKLSLAPGTALVLTTDGLLDSENIRSERFGKDRLRKAARDRLEKSSREIADGVIEDLMRFTENRQEDDITLLVMKIK